LEKVEKKLAVVSVADGLIVRSVNSRLQVIIHLAQRHENQGVFHIEVRVLCLLLLP
jgi:hypothetical protein